MGAHSELIGTLTWYAVSSDSQPFFTAWQITAGEQVLGLMTGPRRGATAAPALKLARHAATNRGLANILIINNSYCYAVRCCTRLSPQRRGRRNQLFFRVLASTKALQLRK